MNCELCNLGKNAASTMLLWYIGLNLFGAAIANEQEGIISSIKNKI